VIDHFYSLLTIDTYECLHEEYLLTYGIVTEASVNFSRPYGHRLDIDTGQTYTYTHCLVAMHVQYNVLVTYVVEDPFVEAFNK
jgi:hypothetical protein